MDKHEIRYNYWIQIASAWLKIIEHLDNTNEEIKTQKDDSSFHKQLSTWTLIGEFVGVQSLQQILNYSSETLIFSSMIDNNNAQDTWMLPEKSIEFWNKWGLRHIPVYRDGFFETKESLKDSLLTTYHQITSGSIRDYEEGSIAMMILRDSIDSNNDRVLSWSKLKTIEYKVFK